MVPKNSTGRFRKGKPRRLRSSKPPPPEVSIDKRPVGRSTLSAILREMHSGGKYRKPFVTVGYDEKPLDNRKNKKGKKFHKNAERDELDAPPDVTISETRPGFETMAIIDEELLRDARELSAEELKSQYAAAEVLELFTFVILDSSLSTAASDEEKKTFVAERLWHRLPAGGMSTVRRIDVRPADETALMMRVWCAVPKATLS